MNKRVEKSLRKERTLERLKRLDTPKSSVSCSAQGSKSISLIINLTISTACSLCVRRRQTVPWVTGPVAVIKPLSTPWLGLGSNGCFDYLSPIVVLGPFLSGRLSLPSLFHLDVPLPQTLGVEVEAPSFSFCLRIATDALTKSLCLIASIFAKGKRRTLDKANISMKQTEGKSQEVRTYTNGNKRLVYKL